MGTVQNKLFIPGCASDFLLSKRVHSIATLTIAPFVIFEKHYGFVHVCICKRGVG